MKPGYLTLAVTLLITVLCAASLWSIALTRPSVFDPPRRAPLARWEALLGQIQPANGDCWSDYFRDWQMQTEYCWYEHYNLTIEGGRVTRVYGRIEGVKAGDILLWYGEPHSTGGFNTVTALRYPSMNVYIRSSGRFGPHSRVYSISLWQVEE